MVAVPVPMVAVPVLLCSPVPVPPVPLCGQGGVYF